MGSKNRKTLEREAQEADPSTPEHVEEAMEARNETTEESNRALDTILEDVPQDPLPTADLETVDTEKPRWAPGEKEELVRRREVITKQPLPKVIQVTEQTLTESGIQLFINAIPPTNFSNLDFYIRAAVRQIEEQFPDLSDIRCPPSADHKLGFGRWRGALAAMVRAQPPQDGTYVVFTRGSEFAEVVAEALMPLSKVTRGV